MRPIALVTTTQANGTGWAASASPTSLLLETARREFREEAGLDLLDMRFRALGTLTFPSFKAHKNEDWVVFVFEADVSREEAARVVSKGDEGELHWVPEGDLLTLNLWPGDRHFIPHVVAGEPFVGTIWYSGAVVSRHWVQRLRRDFFRPHVGRGARFRSRGERCRARLAG